MPRTTHPDLCLTALHLPSLPEEENRRLVGLVRNGISAIGALFLSHLDQFRDLTFGRYEKHTVLMLAYNGFNRAVARTAAGIDPEAFWNSAHWWVHNAIQNDERPRSVVDYDNETFAAKFVNGQATAAPDIETLHELLRTARAGDRAMDALVRHNSYLVFAALRRFRKYAHLRDELFSEGMIGLRKGIARSNPSSDCELATYAVFWIRKTMHRYVKDHGRNVRVPFRQDSEKKRIDTEAEGYAKADGRKRGKWRGRTGHAWPGVDEDIVQSIIRSGSEISTEQPYGDTGDGQHETFGNFLSSGDDPAETALIGQRVEKFRALLGTVLTPEERHVFLRRNLEEHSMAEISRTSGIPLDKVRKYDAQAKEKLRAHLIAAEEGLDAAAILDPRAAKLRTLAEAVLITRERHVFLQRNVEGQTFAEINKTSGIPLYLVARLHAQAKEKMKPHLIEAGITLE